MAEADGLVLWRKVLRGQIATGARDLTARQTALLLTVYLDPPPHTVRGLAARLELPKPAITRAVERLNQLGLVRRKREAADKRSVQIHRTVRGAAYLTDFREAVGRAMRDA